MADLSKDLIKSFAEILAENNATAYGPVNLFGTMHESGEDKFVQLDGSEYFTPVTELVDVKDGDRVLVTLDNHSAVVIGNHTKPPSGRDSEDAKAAIISVKEDIEGITTTVYNQEGEMTSIKQTVSSLTTTVSDQDGRITTVEQTAEGLNNTVSDLDGRVTSAQQTADKFSWIVEGGTTASNMELTETFLEIISEEVKITAPEIHLEGYTTINGGFSVDEYGNMTAVNGTFTGGEIAIGEESSGNSYFIVNSSGAMRTGHVDQWGHNASLSFGNSGLYMSVYDSANSSTKTLYASADGYEIGDTIYGDDYISPGGTLTIYDSVDVEGSISCTGYFTGDFKGTLNGDVSSNSSYLYLGNSSNTLTVGTTSVHSAGSTLGYSGGRWGTIYSTSGEINTSDRTYKEDIRYISNDEVSTFGMSEEPAEFTYKDMYDFVKDDLYLATYKYKEIDGERRYMNFISQDLLANEDGSDNVVGQFIVYPEESAQDQAALQYSSMNYQSVLAGALKQAISEIEKLKARIAELEETK